MTSGGAARSSSRPLAASDSRTARSGPGRVEPVALAGPQRRSSSPTVTASLAASAGRADELPLPEPDRGEVDGDGAEHHHDQHRGRHEHQHAAAGPARCPAPARWHARRLPGQAAAVGVDHLALAGHHVEGVAVAADERQPDRRNGVVDRDGDPGAPGEGPVAVVADLDRGRVGVAAVPGDGCAGGVCGRARRRSSRRGPRRRRAPPPVPRSVTASLASTTPHALATRRVPTTKVSRPNGKHLDAGDLAAVVPPADPGEGPRRARPAAVGRCLSSQLLHPDADGAVDDRRTAGPAARPTGSPGVGPAR